MSAPTDENSPDRRRFLKRTAAASTGVALGFGFEERNLIANAADTPPPSEKATKPEPFPTGRIGDMDISRLICGGNLISGFAHSRDLIYVSSLLRNYFTDEKVHDTLQRCEENGVNTAILRLDQNTLRILNGYRRDRGGKIQWIAQVKLKSDDLYSEIDEAANNGASGIYVHGGIGDKYVAQQRVDLLGKALERIKLNGVIAGIAGHSLDVPVACEKAGLSPDFYMKTINSKSYWSAGPVPRKDSVWSETPEETIEFMKKVKTPWIGYKILGAGAIHPVEGFKYAFENGADFICVGMFDFQIDEDVEFAKKALAATAKRSRPWHG